MSGGLVILGTPGSGPSTVGALVAQARGVLRHDTERLAAADLGHDAVATAFVTVGEDAFRAAETAVALRVLGDPELVDDVVVLGSGVVAVPAVRDALTGRTVVHLTVSLAHAAPRLGLATARPVFLGNPRAQWTRLMEEQRVVFDGVATHVIDTDALSATEVADALASAVAGAPSSSLEEKA